MREGNIFSLSTLAGRVPCPRSGRGVPHPRSRLGITPFQVWIGGPHHDDVGYSIQDQKGVPPSRTGWGTHPPPPVLDGVPPIQDLMGYPPSKTGWGTFPPQPNQVTDQQSKHLLHSGQCASCVHSGGLFCVIRFSDTYVNLYGS